LNSPPPRPNQIPLGTALINHRVIQVVAENRVSICKVVIKSDKTLESQQGLRPRLTGFIRGKTFVTLVIYQNKEKIMHIYNTGNKTTNYRMANDNI
jgi:hypothetical protein